MSETQPRILYVDDDAHTASVFERQMRSLGFSVTTTHSGFQALRILESSPYDVVVSDLRMPRMDGQALLAEIRAAKIDARFILVSGVPELDITRGDQSVDAFFPKPWDPVALSETLRELTPSETATPSPVVQVLLVEDNPGDAELVSYYLDEAATSNYAVQTVSTLAGAVELLHRDTFELIISDLHLPDANRLEIVEMLRRDANDAAVVIVSGNDDEDLATLSVGLGAQDFLVKRDLKPRMLQRSCRFALERKRSERRLARLAHIDELTGLSNRKRLRMQLLESLSRASRKGDPLGLLYVDLDQFKPVNDQLGHDYGDEILKRAAARMQKAVRDYDTVARVGGDEFVILLDAPCTPHQVPEIAERVIETLRVPYVINDRELKVGASVGAALYPRDGNSPEKLFAAADGAMYSAKRSGGNRIGHTVNEADTDIVTQVRRAVNNNEFQLVYQPQLCTKTQHILGVEALLRWFPDGEPVSPGIFVPILEQEGLIVQVGQWVLEKATYQLREWDALGLPRIDMSVNISSRQFEAETLPAEVAAAIDKSGIDPSRLHLEITESILMSNTRATNFALEALKDLQVSLAIDDFGTGYSSLAYLHRFRVDSLKVDRAFVWELGKSAEGDKVTEAIVALGHQLDLTVVAEGIETAEQHEHVRRLECERVQGFYFYKPVSAEKISEIFSPRKLAAQQ